MHIRYYEKHLSNLFAENRLLKIFAFVMMVVTVSNHLLLRRVMNSEKTILVPASLNTKVQILGDKASDEYIKSFAQLASGFAFTYTPVNVQANFAELLSLFAPEAYERTRKTLSELAGTIVNARVSQVFYIQGIVIDPGAGAVEVKGQQVRWVEGAQIENLPKVYTLGYRMENGRFFLTSLLENGAHADGAAKPAVEIEPAKSALGAVEPATKPAGGN